MKRKTYTPKEEFINIFSKYRSNWKFFLLSIIACLLLAFVYLRYSTKEYESSTLIKINNDQQTNKLPELSNMQNMGMLTANVEKVKDEMEILKSTMLIEQVVTDLKLNFRYFVQGRIKDKESYLEPPLSLTFFTSDSIIHTVDTTFYVTVLSNSKFRISTDDTKTITAIGEPSNASVHNFGDKLESNFGGLVLTPNLGTYGFKEGSCIMVEIKPLDEVIEIFQDNLTVENIEGTNIIKLQLDGAIKEKSENFLNKLVEKYNQDVVNDKEEVIKVTSNFINNRLDVISEELQQVDLTAETLKKDNRLSDLASQSTIFLQSERENENRLISTTNQLQLIDYMEEHLNSNSGTGDLLPSNVGIDDPGIAQVTKSHNDLVLQRNRILKNSSEKNPTVINLDNQIKSLKANLDQSLLNLKSSNEITLSSLRKTDSRIDAQIYSTPTKERKFRDITRQQGIKESLYLYLLEKREETAISLGMSSPNAKIIDRAHSSKLPVKPKKVIVYLASLILGLIIPITSIYGKNLLDNKIHDKNDISECLSIPVIGEIPKSKGKAIAIKKVDYSPKAESFRILRTNIDFMLQNLNHKSKIIFVTSTTSKEGKSHTSINLALSLAYSGKNVLFVETDIRVPRASKYLDVNNSQGLTDFISNKNLELKDVVVGSKDDPNLSIIPSGTIPPNPAELLLDQRVEDLFTSVNNQYDYIIVDTAAVGLVTDTLLISRFADLFIYVVRANYLDKRNLQIAQSLFDDKRLPNMTVVLNSVDQKRSYGYGYGYGYGKNPNGLKKWWQFNTKKG
ncbi:GumC family protein [Formosa sp. 3Alg 14/1]|uniref:GumC family protein n=1 Tax=Formosa sp. 3Alg 14/1 TaxID=3382190 RepID=UPI0039BDD835